MIDLAAEDGTAQRDYIVELGSERLVEEVENGILGLSAGESREIAYELADGTTRKATVTVKELKERVLPPLDDDLAKASSEFDTLAELRADIEGRLRAQIDDEIEGLFRAAAIDELVRASEFTAAGPLVEARTRELLERARTQPAGARHRREHLPATHRPDARGARAAPSRRGLAVGLARARARGGRRPARHPGHGRRDPRRAAHRR